MAEFRTATIAALLALALSACVSESPKATWDAAGVDSYTFTVTRSCFCSQEYVGPFTVNVVEGEVAMVTRGRKEIPLGDETLDELPLTVEQIFAYVDHVSTGADDVSVRYDPDLGYPERIEVDWSTNGTDDEMTILVGDFQGT